MMQEPPKAVEAASIMAIIAAVLRLPPEIIGAKTSMDNTPQWDSLKHMEIIFAIEDEFSLEFSEEELATLTSVDHIVTAINSRSVE